MVVWHSSQYLFSFQQIFLAAAICLSLFALRLLQIVITECARNQPEASVLFTGMGKHELFPLCLSASNISEDKHVFSITSSTVSSICKLMHVVTLITIIQITSSAFQTS